MSSVAEVLSHHATSLTEDDVAAVVEAALTAVPSADTQPLTDDEAAFLDSVAPAASTPQVTRQAQADQIARRMRETGELLSSAEVALLRGITVSNVSRAATEGRLFSVLHSGRRYFPQWQFADGTPLPGLPEVIAAIPTDWTLGHLDAVMQAGDESLRGLSPVEWLRSGGAPKQVVALLADLAAW
jgi:hypothetical protein